MRFLLIEVSPPVSGSFCVSTCPSFKWSLNSGTSFLSSASRLHSLPFACSPSNLQEEPGLLHIHLAILLSSGLSAFTPVPDSLNFPLPHAADCDLPECSDDSLLPVLNRRCACTFCSSGACGKVTSKPERRECNKA